MKINWRKVWEAWGKSACYHDLCKAQKMLIRKEVNRQLREKGRKG